MTYCLIWKKGDFGKEHIMDLYIDFEHYEGCGIITENCITETDDVTLTYLLIVIDFCQEQLLVY